MRIEITVVLTSPGAGSVEVQRFIEASPRDNVDANLRDLANAAVNQALNGMDDTAHHGGTAYDGSLRTIRPS